MRSLKKFHPVRLRFFIICKNIDVNTIPEIRIDSFLIGGYKFRKAFGHLAIYLYNSMKIHNFLFGLLRDLKHKVSRGISESGQK